MTDDSNAPRGLDWGDVVEVLHGLTNTMATRTHYPDGHPAIVRADESAGTGFVRLLERLPELVVALIDGEFVIGERPFPHLRERIHLLADAMTRHGVECLVFQRGMTSAECATLGRLLGLPADEPDRVRTAAQKQLSHVLLRFVELKKTDARAAIATSAHHFVGPVGDMLTAIGVSLGQGQQLDRAAVRNIAKEILSACSLRSFVLCERAWSRSLTELATHAANVAMIAGAMALESELPDPVCVDLVSAALVHDIGHLLLPEEVRGLAEPLVEPRMLPLFRNHTFAGASALLAAGAPALWVEAALGHHRGVDGGGYPALETNGAPSELVRIIALANYFDRKRTLLGGRSLGPDAVLAEAAKLEDRYFGRPLVARFVRALGIFPPGTTVELSNREPALVVGANTSDPWRPRVLVLRGELANRRIDLRELDTNRGVHALSIVRAILPPLFVLADVDAEAAASVTAHVARPAPSERPRVSARPIPRGDDEESPTATPMVDVLDTIASGRLVTSPPAPPSAPPARMSRPVVIQEVLGLPRGYSAAPSGSSASIPAVKISVPAMPAMKAPVIDSRAEAPEELPLDTVLRPSGAPPAGLDHRGAFLLGFIDGMSSLEDIIDASGVPKAEVLRIVGELVANGNLKT